MKPTTTLYRVAGPALLRASATPITDRPARWPNLEDADDCRGWLAQVWPQASDAVAVASSALSARIEQISCGHAVPDDQVRAAAGALVRYLLRAGGRPTPFALFAGVVPAGFGGASLRFGTCHRAHVRADAAWLAEIIDELETGPLLPHLRVVFNDLAAERADQLHLPRPEGRAQIRLSEPVRLVREVAREPVWMSELADRLAERFPAVAAERIAAMLRELVGQRFLITGLRAPMGAADPLGHLLAALHDAAASYLPEVAPVLAQLEEIHTDLTQLNRGDTAARQRKARADLAARMDRLKSASRSPLAVDLALDVELRLPESVAADMALAADVLTRIGRAPLGPAVWADYHRRFVERYGISTAVPLAEVLDASSGLGYPAGYPGSVLPKPAETVSQRDQRLLSLAWSALIHGGGRLELTDDAIAALCDGNAFDTRFIPPHVEIAARIRAVSMQAIEAGDYVLAVSPARSAGILSARFQHLTGDAAMQTAYQRLPSLVDGGVPAQVCCPPMFVRGQNVARLPVFTTRLLALGEPPMPPGPVPVLRASALAVTATGRGLLLLDQHTGSIIEPQVLHALDLERQMPPLTRFLAHLPRAFAAAFTAFDFGPAAAALPHLPEVRYGRIILAPERWRLTDADLPGNQATAQAWREALACWREHTGCPELVELADGDMTLRLDLSEPAHARVLREHLAGNKNATLNRAAEIDDFGWIGHAHEIVAPLFRGGPPAPNKMAGAPALISNTDGDRPDAPDARWISTRLHTHPGAMDHIIGAHLPQLITAVGDVPLWAVRYRNPEQTDHLRIRLHAGDGSEREKRTAALGTWAAKLSAARLSGRFVLDTYFPEVGRYGTGPVLAAAETVFCADTRAAIITLRRPPADLHPDTLTTLGMLDLAEAFLGGMDAATDWLTSLPTGKPQTIDRAAVRATTNLARLGIPRELDALPAYLADAWAARAAAAHAYRRLLPEAISATTVAASLLHLHFNRHRGIRRDHEAACLRLARSAALAWRATLEGVAA